MKRFKKYISIILSVQIVFITTFFCYEVKAEPDSGWYGTIQQIFDDWHQDQNQTEAKFEEIMKNISNVGGFITNPLVRIESIRQLLDNHASGSSSFGSNYPTNGTDQEKIDYACDYMSNNTVVTGNSITVNDNSKALIEAYQKAFAQQNGYIYLKSFNASLFQNLFGSATQTRVAQKFISDHQQNYFINISGNTFYLVPYANDLAFVLNSSNGGFYSTGLYNFDTWNGYDIQSVGEKWDYDSTSETYVKDTSDPPMIYLGLNAMVDDINNWNMAYNPNQAVVSVGGEITFKVYLTVEDMKSGSLGHSPYYINNTVKNSWDNSTGDYTLGSNNDNSTNYGDINTYIDNTVNTTNKYPTPEEITRWIEDPVYPTPLPTPTPTPTPDNPSGGGNGGSVSGNTANGGSASASATANNSGVSVTVNNNHNINLNIPGLSGNGIGSGTVSGNGSGSGGIFDWISDIGGVIGDFIKNVGQLIADVIKGITETITTVLADIPNIISVLVEFVYGGLPDELKAIVTLGITTVIFVGVIKMMRK